MSLYVTGTITGALNATTISGTGTKWSDAKIGITNGSVLFVSSNAGVDGVYQVKRVISDTSIELAQPIFKAFNASKYSIMVAESASTAAWSNQLAATLGYYQAQMDGWQQIMTGTGDIALTAPDGTKVTFKSFTKMSQDIDKKQDKSDILTDLSKSKDADGVREYLGIKENLVLRREAASTTDGAGGIFQSQMWKDGVMLGQARFYHEFRGDGKHWTTISNEKPGIGAYIGLREDGYVALPKAVSTGGRITSGEYVFAQPIVTAWSIRESPFFTNTGMLDGMYSPIVGCQSIASPKGYGGGVQLGVVADKNAETWPRPVLKTQLHDNATSYAVWDFRHASGGNVDQMITGANLTIWGNGTVSKSVQWQGTSDERLKHNIIDNDGTDSFDRIMALRFTNFIYNDDEKERLRRGIIAQQAIEIEPDYVKQIQFGENNELDTLVIDNNPIVMDLIGTVQVLSTKIKEQDIKINEQEKRLLALEKMKDSMDE
uniref:tail fiber domain-containing protein n=1 Tax=Hafnia alvei TaxID=569 RepID=UPI00266BE9FB|nr:tail fiber domain-containing protein [Hafnia alvei]